MDKPSLLSPAWHEAPRDRPPWHAAPRIGLLETAVYRAPRAYPLPSAAAAGWPSEIDSGPGHSHSHLNIFTSLKLKSNVACETILYKGCCGAA